ncbi:MAG: hypothetical protein ACAI44_24625 [Candidatus Sericytochromatia bacterium]
MMRRLAGVALALLAAIGAAGSAAAIPALLVTSPEGLRPIAIYEGNKFFQPAQNLREQELLGKDLLERSRDLPLFFNGEEKNAFALSEFRLTPPPCSGGGLWAGTTKHPLTRPLLSFTPDFPGPRRYIGSYPSSSFNKLADQMSRKVYQAHKVPAAKLAGLKIRHIDPFTLINGTRILVSVESDIFPVERSCPDYNLLMVFEKVGLRYKVVLERFRHNTRDCAGYRLLGSFASGPTIDKLVVQGSSPTASWYDIFQIQAFGGLKQVYHGGGHSCSKT